MPALNPLLCLSPSTPIACTPLSLSFLHRRPSVQWERQFGSPKRSFCGLLQFGGSKDGVLCALSAASTDSEGPPRFLVEGIESARKVFNGLPQPVRSFPWSQLTWNFQNIVLVLVMAVLKYLSVPVLTLTSLSEMSYCAHERKMRVILIPFLVGLVLAGVLKDAAVELSPALKEAGFPWHLFLIASFFILLKLPGPSYLYWGRLIIPHFANGGLWRTVWLVFSWYRSQLEKSGETKGSV